MFFEEINGKNTMVNLNAGEDKASVMKEVYAAMGASPTKYFTKEVTLQEVMDYLDKRFGIVTCAHKPGQSKVLYDNMAKVLMTPDKAEGFVYMTIDNQDKMDDLIRSIGLERFDRFEGYLVSKDTSLTTLLDSSKRVIGSFDFETNTLTRSVNFTREQSEAFDWVDKVKSIVIVPPVRVIRSAPTQTTNEVKSNIQDKVTLSDIIEMDGMDEVYSLDKFGIVKQKMSKIKLDIKSKEMFIKAVKENGDVEIVAAIRDLLEMPLEAFNIFTSFEVDSDKKALIMIYDGKKLTYSNYKLTVDSSFSDEDIEDVSELLKTEVTREVLETTIMPDAEKEEPSKPLQKSIITEATLVDEPDNKDSISQSYIDSTNARKAEVIAKQKVEVSEDEKVKTTTITNPEQTISLSHTEQVATRIQTPEMILADPNSTNAQKFQAKKAIEATEEAKQKVEVTDTVSATITNPDQPTSLANTEQVAVKVDIELLKTFINMGTINNIPTESRDSILLRLEAAIRKVSAEPDWKEYLDMKDKYAFSKTRYVSKDVFALINKTTVMEFEEGGFQFTKKVK